MRLVIIVASPDAAIEQGITQYRGALVPEPFRKNGYQLLGGTQVTISYCFATLNGTVQQLAAHVEHFLRPDIVGLIIISDHRLKSIVDTLNHIAFTSYYLANDNIRSFPNFFGVIFNRTLRDYRAFSIKFDDLKFRKLFTLPIRNFRAEELEDLCGICTSSSDAPNFANRLEGALKALRARQQPKRFSDSPEIYLVDQDEKHFRLGHERHARADTAIPPHNNLCILGNNWRFGRKFDNETHYNVSMSKPTSKMDKDYPDCHGVPRPGKSRTHLNMFTNDFF